MGPDILEAAFRLITDSIVRLFACLQRIHVSRWGDNLHVLETRFQIQRLANILRGSSHADRENGRGAA